jgi:hypothetical protein
VLFAGSDVVVGVDVDVVELELVVDVVLDEVVVDDVVDDEVVELGGVVGGTVHVAGPFGSGGEPLLMAHVITSGLPTV